MWEDVFCSDETNMKLFGHTGKALLGAGTLCLRHHLLVLK